MITWTKIALVFPGQGSQMVGMGAEFAAQSPAAREVFSVADRVYGMPFAQLCFEGPASELDQTANTQPALYVTGIAILRALEEMLGEAVTPLAAAGHSLGEFTALTAAGALPYEDGLRLVRERGRLMAEAGLKNPGAMAALLGASVEDARTITREASDQIGKSVVVANDNCPGQVVISGDSAAVDKALEVAKVRGIKRAIKLAVSVAAHSPLMAEAQLEFRRLLEQTPFNLPRYPVIANLSAAPLASHDDILNELTSQLTGAVRWTETIQTIQSLGAEVFLELGSKDVLSGLIRRIDGNLRAIPVNAMAALTALL
ncbi:MAG: ACP S-malonyltransferase [Anaerolineae bacterium]